MYAKVGDFLIKPKQKRNFSAFFLKTFWEIQNKAITLHSHSAKGCPLGASPKSNATMRIVLWCNGNTTGFGSVIPGSNPGSTTLRQKRHPRSTQHLGCHFFSSSDL